MISTLRSTKAVKLFRVVSIMFVFLFLNASALFAQTAVFVNTSNTSSSDNQVITTSLTGGNLAKDGMSAEVWVRPDGNTYSSGDRIIMQKDGDFMLVLMNLGNIGVVVWPNGPSDSSYIFVESGTQIAQQTWAHIAFIYKNSHLALFINGVQDKSVNFSAGNYSGFSVANPASVLNIGNGVRGTFTTPFGFGQAKGFYGQMTELRIWNRVLCTSEIVNNMNCAIASPNTGLLLYYKFDPTFVDNSGNGYNGTSTGVTISGASGKTPTTCQPYTPLSVASGITNATFCSSGSSTLTNINIGTFSIDNPDITSNITYDNNGYGSLITLVPAASFTATSSPAAATITFTPFCPVAASTQAVTMNPTPTVTLSPSSVAMNPGKSVTITASNSIGSTFSWTPNASFSTSGNTASFTGPNIVTRTTYTQQATASNQYGCSRNVSVVVTSTPLPAVGSIAADQTICSGLAPANLTNVSGATLNASATTYRYGLYKSTDGINWSRISGVSTSPVLPAINATLLTQNTYFKRSVEPSSNPNKLLDTAYSNTVLITVTAAPVISGTNTIIAGGTTTLNATQSGSWSSSNTAVATVDNNGLVTAIAPGTTTINITTTCATGTFTVTVIQPVVAIITAGGPTTFCSGGSVTLTASAGDSYLWSSGETTQSITVSGSGSYTVAITTGGNTSTSAATTVTVNPLPAATISGTATVCQNDAPPTIAFTGANGISPYTFTYTVNSGSPQTVISSGNTATVNASTTTAGSTVYTLLSVKDASALACSNTASGSATIKVSPLATVNAVSNQVICANNATTAISFTGSIPGTLYNWTNSAASIGLAASGTGNIPSFTATNASGSPVTATVTVTPTAAIGYAYIANANSGNVSVIKTSTNSVVATISLGTVVHLEGIAVSPDGSKVYVCKNGNGTVAVVNTATNTLLTTITVGSSPSGVVVSPDGSRVYVTNQSSGTVSVINTVSNTVVATVTVGSFPQGITISPDGSKVYVGNYFGNSVSVINTTTNTVSATINLTLASSVPADLCVSPDGSRVYVTASNVNSLYSINTSTNAVTAINIGRTSQGISISPDGSKVYASNNYTNVLSVINTATNTLTNTIPVGAEPYGVSVSSDGSTIYVNNATGGTVSVINAATETVTNTVPVGSAPKGMGRFVSASTAACTGNPVSFTITVNPTPVVSGVSGNTNICAGSVTTLTASSLVSNATFNWYDAATGGNLLFTGAVFTTSALSNNTTYYVAVSSNGCVSPSRFAVTVAVNAIPTVSGITGSINICSGNTTTLTASSSAATPTFNWYSVSTGGSPLFTGANFTTPVLSSNTTYYAEVVSGGTCISAVRSAVTVNVTSINDQTVTVSPAAICGSGTATVSLASSQAGVNYTLRNNANNNIIAGPVAGTGSAISFNTGTISSSTTYNVFAQTAVSGGALNYNGSNNYLTAPHNASLNLSAGGQLTLEAWINPGNGGRWRNIVMKGSYGYGMAIDASNRLYFWDQAFGDGNNTWSDVTVPVNTWSHVAITVQDNGPNLTVTLYLNGVNVGNKTSPQASINDNTEPLYIGTQGTCFCNYFSGKMDELRIWNTVRTASQILGSMNSCLTGSESGLIADYKFDETAGSTAVDAKSGNNATLFNFSLPAAWTTGTLNCGTQVASCSLQMSSTPTVTINPLPTPAITGPSAVCVGSAITLTGSPANGVWSSPSGSPIVDQSNGPSGNQSGGLLQWQSFTAGVSGSLASIDISHGNPLGTDGVATITVQVYTGVGTGGTLLGTQTYTYPAQFGSGFVNYAFSGVNLIQGQQYTFVVTTPTVHYSWLNVNVNGGYAGGNYGPYQNQWDMVFKTNMIPLIATVNNSGVVTGFSAGVTNINYTVTNASGCTSTASVPVTVNALPAAAITAGGSTTLCAGGSLVLTASAGTAYFWSNGDTIQFINANISGNYTVKVTNANGCSATSTATTVTVNPLLTANLAKTDVVCPGGNTGSITVMATNGTAPYQYSANGGVSYQASNVFSGLAAGSYPIFIKDANGCSNGVGTVTVNQADTIAPVITVPSNITITATGVSGAVVNYTAPTATDNCSVTVALTAGLPSGSVFPLGTTNVTYTATDASGNTATGSFLVTVSGSLPVISCPANIMAVATDGLCGANVNFTAFESAAIPASVIVYSVNGNTVQSGSFFPVGTTAVMATATNVVGSSNCTFTVTVADKQFPVLTGVPADVTVECDAVPAPVIVQATDNCSTSAPTFTEVRTNGNCLGSYILTRTWSTTDASGNTTTASQIITVQDTKAPVLSAAPSNITVACDAVPAAAVLTATDNCSTPAVTFTETRVNGTSPGNYTLTRIWTATDACENATSVSQTIIVKDTQAPVPNITSLPVISGTCTVTVGSHPTATDNCAGTIIGSTTDPLSYSGVGTYTIHWTYNDGNGNSSAQSQTVTVIDNIKPVVYNPADITVTCSNLVSPSITGMATATDNCSTPVISYSDVWYSPTILLRFWKATDAAGNVSNIITAQTITILDNIKPVITNPADITVNCGSSILPSVTGTATATDNCSTPEITYSDVWYNNTTLLRFWKATDAAGNVSNIINAQTIRIVDNIKPAVVNPADITVTCSTLTSPSITGTATATDNCGTPVVTYSDVWYNSTTLLRFWKATDGFGNVSNIITAQTITINDNIKPVISDPADITVNCGASTLPSATGTATATDNCGTPTVTYSDVQSGNVITRTWKATDGFGNIATSTQLITIGAVFTASITSVPTNNTYTGGVPTNLYLGYGAQSTTLQTGSLPSAGAPYKYLWSGTYTNKLSSATSAAPVFTPSTSGYYTFNVTVTNKYGCTSSCSISICVMDIRVPGTNGLLVYVCHQVALGYITINQSLSLAPNLVPLYVSSNPSGNNGTNRLGSCDQSPCNTTIANATGGSNQATAKDAETTTVSSEEDFKVTAMPNPTTTFFTLKIESRYQTPVALRVMDAQGRVVDARSKIGANSTIQIGHNYSSGTYYAELIQGTKRKVVQLIKGRG